MNSFNINIAMAIKFSYTYTFKLLKNYECLN